MKASRKFEIFSKIRWQLDHHKHATPRELGMTEQEFRELADGTQFHAEKLEDTGHILDNYVISGLLQLAEDLLANPPKTDWARIGTIATLAIFVSGVLIYICASLLR